MEHLLIFGLIANLIVGTWAIIITRQTARDYLQLYLKSIFQYTVLYNFCILTILVALYSNLNLPKNFLQEHFPAGSEIMELLISLFFIGMVMTMLRIALGFRDKDLSSKARFWIAAVMVMLVLSYIFKFSFPNLKPSLRWLDWIHAEIWDNFLVLEIPVLIAMIITAGKEKDRGKRKVIKSFAILYLLRYASVVIALPLLLIPRELRLSVLVVIFISFNVIPFLWFKAFFLPYAQGLRKLVQDSFILEPIYEKYGISRREKEILELMLTGKNNKEIGKVLFISYHTVKNHVYNLYQKLGVKNRYELLHFFAKAETSRKESNPNPEK